MKIEDLSLNQAKLASEITALLKQAEAETGVSFFVATTVESATGSATSFKHITVWCKLPDPMESPLFPCFNSSDK